MKPFDDCWPSAKFNGDYIAFLHSMTKAERIAWRKRTDKERNKHNMARGRPAKPTQATALIEALDFIEDATGKFMAWHQFIRLGGKVAIAFNGQMAAGHPIVEELNLCPQLDKLRIALKRVGKSLTITETPANQLSIKGEHLRALVPCMTPGELAGVMPDAMLCPLTDTIKEAFRVCGVIASEKAENFMQASLLLEANQCTSTNGAAVLQYWHGFDLPPAMVLPKAFADAVAKQTKPLIGFGFSWLENNPMSIVATVTFWFEGGGWIKTQCYQDRWQDIGKVLDVAVYPSDTLVGLFMAIEATSHFNDDGFVTFADGKVMSHDTDAAGAQYEVTGLQGGKKFNGKLIKTVSPYAVKIDLTTYPDRAFFFGGTAANPVRGAIMGLPALITESFELEPGTLGGAEIMGDDDGPTEAEADQTQGWGC